MAKLEVLKTDITKLALDAIVNAANSSLMGGGGVDGAIHRAAGPQLLEECRKIAANRSVACTPGDAVITKGYNLPARFIIHTVGPIWNDGAAGEPEALRSCYVNCLKLADRHGIRSIAFPAISTGVYRFPKPLAAEIAVKTIAQSAAATAITEIFLIAFDDETLGHYRKHLARK
jgi:O-acetyl-ADP-ribose deacetylase (regulator of RNase III)